MCEKGRAPAAAGASMACSAVPDTSQAAGLMASNDRRDRSRRDLWIHLLLYPGHTLPTAAAPVIVAIGLAIHYHVFAPLPALVGFIGSWLIHVGGVFTDNYELLRQHPHLPEHPELLRGVQNGSFSLRHLKLAIWACFGLALLTAPYLFDVGGIIVLIIGIVGAAASFFYAGSRYAYAKRGWADPIFFVMFGEVAVIATYYIQVASVVGMSSLYSIPPYVLPGIVFVIGVPVGALVTNVLVIDDIRDRDFDRAKGWRTPAVRFGIRWSRAEFTALMTLAYLAPIFFWLSLGYGMWSLLPLLTLPLAYRIAHTVRNCDCPKDLLPMTPQMARLALLYSILLGIALALTRL